MKKKRHDGDCTYYSALCNDRPEDGICTCGYAHQLKVEVTGNYIENAYSKELRTALAFHRKRSEYLNKHFEEMLTNKSKEEREKILKDYENL